MATTTTMTMPPATDVLAEIRAECLRLRTAIGDEPRPSARAALTVHWRRYEAIRAELHVSEQLRRNTAPRVEWFEEELALVKRMLDDFENQLARLPLDEYNYSAATSRATYQAAIAYGRDGVGSGELQDAWSDEHAQGRHLAPLPIVEARLEDARHRLQEAERRIEAVIASWQQERHEVSA